MTDAARGFWLAIALATAGLLWLLAPVLAPFLTGALLAYLGDPLVDALGRRGYTRGPAVMVVFVAMTLVAVLGLLVVVPAVAEQLQTLVATIPRAIAWAEANVLPHLVEASGASPIGIDPGSVGEALRGHWREVGGAVVQVLGQAGASGQLILGWLAYFTLVPVVTFYLLRDWDELLATVRRLLPRSIEGQVVQLVGECDAVLAQFVRGQLLVMVAMAVIYVLGLLMVGLDLAVLIGGIAGLVSFVPYLGVILGVGLASLAALVQFHDLGHLLGVWAVFGIGQFVEGLWLSPWLVGDRIGLHPVAVIFAVMAGGQLFGFFGVLLALPVAAVIVVLARHAHALYLESSLYGA